MSKKNKCIFGCGRDEKYKKHGCCDACYSSVWTWTRKKSAVDRKQRKRDLQLFAMRIDAVNDKLIRIQRAEDISNKRRRRR